MLDPVNKPDGPQNIHIQRMHGQSARGENNEQHQTEAARQ